MNDNHNFAYDTEDMRCVYCDARPGGRAGSQPCPFPGGHYRPAEDE